MITEYNKFFMRCILRILKLTLSENVTWPETVGSIMSGWA